MCENELLYGAITSYHPMKARSRESRIHRLQFEIEWPPGHVACYLVDGPEPVLIDAATPDRETAFRRALAEHDYEPSDIEHVLVTHPHVDHVGLVPTVLEDGNPTVYAPAGVRERFDRDPADLETRVRDNCVQAGIPDDHLENAVEMAVESLERDTALLPPASVDVWIDQGQTTAVGSLDVEAIHTPGHQADHTSYLADVDGEEVLFAGDMAIEPFRPVIIHDGLDDGHREAFDAFYTALDRLDALDVTGVYPAHGPIHDDLPGTVDRDRESLDQRLEQVYELVENGSSSVAGVAMALAGEGDLKYLFPEVMSALVYLEREGDVTSEQRDGVTYYSA